jgi:hypothetical protein
MNRQCLLSMVLLAVPELAHAETNDGLRVVHVGNSHSHYLRFVDALSRSVGHPKQKVGEINILGAPLSWNWTHPEQNNWPKTLAPDKTWDAITLLAWKGDDEDYAVRFAGEFYKGSPRGQVFIYTIWPEARMDWEKSCGNLEESHTEKVAAAVAKAFPDKLPPRVIPSSLVIRELGRLADEGRLPHVASRFQMFADGAHLSQYGHYAVLTMVTAMLYNESPLNYPRFVKNDVWGGVADCDVPEETAQVIKQMVWDVLTTYPPACLTTGLAIATRSLSPAVAGLPYRVPLAAVNAAGSVRWEAKLPEGLKLSSDGTIDGTLKRTGWHELVVTASDSNAKTTRTLILRVDEDTPPVIPTEKLPTVSLDTYVFEELKAKGGVGRLDWQLADGKLPAGVKLMRHGILVGTPGEAGLFRVTVRATDTHPGKAQSVTRVFEWNIGPASAAAAFAKTTDQPITIDGKADEPCWEFVNKIEKIAAGQPAKKATFAVIRQETGKGRDVKQALYVAVRVMDGPGGKTNGDAVEFFIDALHNREQVYNADDNHIIVYRTGKMHSFHHVADWALYNRIKVQEIEGGFVVEMMVPALFGQHDTNVILPKDVYGFDVAVVEGKATESRQVWRGDANNDKDTSHFGSIVLTDEPVTRYCEITSSVPVVKIEHQGEGWQLLRNGQPFLVKGAVGWSRLDQLAAAGANAVRIGTDEKVLNQAQRLGLSALVGLPLGLPRRGFDYASTTQTAAQRAKIRELVLKLKNHPAVLMWAIGNEPTIFTPKEQRIVLWKEVNHIAELVHSLDPNHPVIAVVGGEQWKRNLGEMDEFSPALDAVGLNAYADMLTLPEDLAKQGWKRPYLITEFGPRGHWQVAKTSWGARIEDSSTEKAEVYRRAFEHAIKGRPQCLGSFVFLWGWKMEKTHTWYGMFLEDGSRTEAVDVLAQFWTGKPPVNRSPRIGPGKIQMTREPGTPLLHCSVEASDPEGDPLAIEWDLRRDVASNPAVGGDFELLEPAIKGAVLESKGAAAVIRLPEQAGNYRVFVYVRDGKGGAATANVPVLAK